LEKQYLKLVKTTLPKEGSKVSTKYHCAVAVARTAPTPPATCRNNLEPYPEYKQFFTADSWEGLVAIVGEPAAVAMRDDDPTMKLVFTLDEEGKGPANAEEELPSAKQAKAREKPRTLSADEVRQRSLVESVQTSFSL